MTLHQKAKAFDEIRNHHILSARDHLVATKIMAEMHDRETELTLICEKLGCSIAHAILLTTF